MNKNFKKQLNNWIKACAMFCSWENIVSVVFSVIIYFTVYQNFKAHKLTTIKSCSFQYDDFSLLTDPSSTSVPENTNRERNRSKYENTYFAIVNNMIAKLRGEGRKTTLWIWFTKKIKRTVFQILCFMLLWSIFKVKMQVPISSLCSLPLSKIK